MELSVVSKESDLASQIRLFSNKDAKDVVDSCTVYEIRSLSAAIIKLAA